MPSIKLKSLRFEQPAFRKLGDIKISFAERMTIIAGHNGIGKSTILGIVSNGSGLNDSDYQSYFRRMFVANLNEIIHLDHEREFNSYKVDQKTLPSPFIDYEIDSAILVKRSAMTERRNEQQVRVVPRNDPYEPVISDSGIEIGKDAKVPLPTLYLGMTRMLPVGESDPRSVMNSVEQAFDADDAEFIESFIGSVIGIGLENASGRITTQAIKGTKKTTKHPEYAYHTKCISLGQDSLSAIATALASFKKLKREWKEYPGGLLVIDELDAGFHPHAQQKLVKALCGAARALQLQIVATTHSMCLIEAIHPESRPVGKGGKHVDSVVYITDTSRPRIAEDYSLNDIRRDMSLLPPEVAARSEVPVLKIYLEDPEAQFFLERLLTRALKMRVKREAAVRLKPIPLSVGCENLQRFHKHDAYFKTVLIVLDADASIAGPARSTRNIVKLPGGRDGNGRGLSPERTLHAFIKQLADENNLYPAAREKLKRLKVSSDQLREHLLVGYATLSNRESAKKWMTARLDFIKQWELVEIWLAEYPAYVEAFNDSLLAASIATAGLIRQST
ncbi:AAA family ATPase [Paraburkholderia pallida]|uniref:ATP-binding protein n=1 Tax=Paraburkholderia pallida TaxID=2547399 RepID=A0A4P7CSS1_9BURK|nr:AAA family ATPase [Paraburkholderia pallida]QBQ98157.1 ATP-binding protein [Paraburkholderia pallida]